MEVKSFTAWRAVIDEEANAFVDAYLCDDLWIVILHSDGYSYHPMSGGSLKNAMQSLALTCPLEFVSGVKDAAEELEAKVRS